tara:strand:+ start:801 stop:1529 length:729 start_codon:yes stop_codon:yes gene_type:complete
MTKRIAMWSGPRNISTAMMRSFDSRGDTFVSDEPMYGNFLSISELDHPLKNQIIASMETDRLTLHEYLSTFKPKEASVWYQKQMAHHILIDDDLDWIKGLDNVFLIRDPKKVILSYVKKYNLDDESLIGFIQIKRIFDYVIKNISSTPIVIDADDILRNPQQMLSKLCELVDISFIESMLSWEKGFRDTDGIWAPHWYDSVINSNAFNSYEENNNVLPQEYSDIYVNSLKIYNQLYNYRIKI